MKWETVESCCDQIMNIASRLSRVLHYKFNLALMLALYLLISALYHLFSGSFLLFTTSFLVHFWLFAASFLVLFLLFSPSCLFSGSFMLFLSLIRCSMVCEIWGINEHNWEDCKCHGMGRCDIHSHIQSGKNCQTIREQFRVEYEQWWNRIWEIGITEKESRTERMFIQSSLRCLWGFYNEYITQYNRSSEMREKIMLQTES